MTPPAAGAATGIVSYINPRELDEQLRRDALQGLTSSPKSIPSKYFYDERGSDLFDQITRVPEYYPFRAEREILVQRAGRIASHAEADTIVELGSGTSEKTGILLDAFCRTGQLERYVPFDVDPDTLSFAAIKLNECYPEVEVAGICGDFERHLGMLTQPGRAMVVFLGSTIGNLDPGQRKTFLSQLANGMKPRDSFLLGIDLVKDVATIEAAYNDSQGVAADFNLNMLNVLNGRLGGDFKLSGFEYLATFNPVEERMEMRLRSVADQTVRLGKIDLEIDFERNEALHTEISTKFRREGVESELAEAGLEPAKWWTDAGGRFALSLSFRNQP